MNPTDILDPLKRLALEQFLSKPEPIFGECGCMGPRDDQPRCPCKMRMCEMVEGCWYEISEHRSLEEGVYFSVEKIT